MTEAQLRRDQVLLGLSELIGRRSVGTWPRIAPFGEALNGREVVWLTDVEAAKFPIPDHAVLVDQHAVGDSFEAERRRAGSVFVGQICKRRSGGFDVRSGVFPSVMLARDRDDLEIGFRGKCRVKTLPPGQLLATASPGSPPEEQRALAAQRIERQLATLHAGKGQGWDDVAN